MNPFARCVRFGGRTIQTQIVDVKDRLSAVKSFNLQQCRAACRVPGLQKNVRAALAARINSLEKQQRERETRATDRMAGGRQRHTT